jgi:hypothetical protein
MEPLVLAERWLLERLSGEGAIPGTKRFSGANGVRWWPLGGQGIPVPRWR